MNSTLRKFLLVFTLFLPLASGAGGLHLYEIGTTDLGLAAAGTAARAEDAATVYTNPAGMTRLSGNQMTLGAQLLYGKAEYTLDTGTNIGNVSGWRPSVSAFYSHSLSDRLKLGVALYGNYGMELDLGNQWAGRSLIGEVALKAMTLQPTVAYRLDERWSLGAGLVGSYGFTKLERFSGGATRKISDSDWAFGARLGVLYEPNSSTRFGLTWESRTQHEFNMPASVGGPYATALNLGVRPEQLMASVWQRLNDRWAVMGNLGWQGWSKFTNTAMDGRGLMLRDTWHAALGAQYTLDAKTKLNAGVAYDSSFYKSQMDSAIILPNGAVWRIGAGMQYALTPKDELGLALGYLRAQSSHEPAPSIPVVRGTYDQPQIFFMSVHYSHKF